MKKKFKMLLVNNDNNENVIDATSIPFNINANNLFNTSI